MNFTHSRDDNILTQNYIQLFALAEMQCTVNISDSLEYCIEMNKKKKMWWQKALKFFTSSQVEYDCWTNLENIRAEFRKTFECFSSDTFQPDLCALYYTLIKLKSSEEKCEDVTYTNILYTLVQEFKKILLQDLKYYVVIKGSEYLKKGEAGKAVEKVVYSIKNWGEHEKLKMFVICDHKFNLGISKEYSLAGDHDVAIMCEKIGFIFIQVKSNIPPKQFCSNIKRNIVKAHEQLYKDLIVMSHILKMNNIDVTNVPIYGFIAMPNIQKNKMFDALSSNRSEAYVPLCPGHTLLVLGREEISTCNFLNGLLQKHKDPPKRWDYEDILKIV